MDAALEQLDDDCVVVDGVHGPGVSLAADAYPTNNGQCQCAAARASRLRVHLQSPLGDEESGGIWADIG